MLKQKCGPLLFGEDSMDESGLHFCAIAYRKTVVLQSLQESILLEVPMIILYPILRKQFIEGVAMTGEKYELTKKCFSYTIITDR